MLEAGVTRDGKTPTLAASLAPNKDCVMLDPATRYDLTGHYDAENYDRDREEFPSEFDKNGWPLFGNYDPYSLHHPITGRRWLESPRIPSDDEVGTAYYMWLKIAEDFLRIEGKIFKILTVARKTDADAPKTDTGNFYYTSGLYRDGVELGFWGSIEHLKATKNALLPLLEERSICLEFSIYWGEYNKISERAISSFSQMNTRRVKKDSGGRDSEKAQQLQWYKYWRAHCDTTAKISVQKANRVIVDYCWKIAEGDQPPPEGFDTEWFLKLLGEKTVRVRSKEGTINEEIRPARDRSNAMKRSGYHREDAAELLRAYEAERDKLPPFPDLGSTFST